MSIRNWGLGLEQLTELYHKYGLYWQDVNPELQNWFIDRGTLDEKRLPIGTRTKSVNPMAPLKIRGYATEMDLIGFRLNIKGNLEEIRLIQCKEKVGSNDVQKLLKSFEYFPRMMGISRYKPEIMTKCVAYVNISPKARLALTERDTILLSFQDMVKKLLSLIESTTEKRRTFFLQEPILWMLRTLKDQGYVQMPRVDGSGNQVEMPRT